MGPLQSLLERLDTSAYEPECVDDMTHHFVPVHATFYHLDDGRIGVDWFNREGNLLNQPDGTSTEFYDANAFWDAIEDLGLLRAGVATRYGGKVSVRGSDEKRLHRVIETIRELTQFFAAEAARPVI